MVSRTKLIGFLLAFTTFSIVSCSDNSTSADQPEPPAVPEAIPAQINSTVFDANNPTGEDFALFNEASAYAETAEAQINSETFLGQTYLDFTRSTDSEFEDGTWTWSFSSSQSGFDVSVRTTAEELQNAFEWNVYVNGAFDGETVDEFLFLSGFISKEGENGNWRYFSPENTDQPFLEYQWEVIDENSSSFSTIFSGFSGNEQQRIDYVQNGTDNTLLYSGFDSIPDLEVYWNSENGTGYIDKEGENRRCWDESFAETSCG